MLAGTLALPAKPGQSVTSVCQQGVSFIIMCPRACAAAVMLPSYVRARTPLIRTFIRERLHFRGCLLQRIYYPEGGCRVEEGRRDSTSGSGNDSGKNVTSTMMQFIWDMPCRNAAAEAMKFFKGGKKIEPPSAVHCIPDERPDFKKMKALGTHIIWLFL